ncbi:hypothetical protein BH92_26435 [Rhodococcoides fascians A21d2]|uniref:hypothetical protein n=1 Tax=Nocardiaceae TaxID=85025 RepID=UPI0012D32ED7|nr:MULTISPECIES: hypothetical protein [Rhodococcus]QII02934.1 hypothetical protein BH92_26435 [Rhodococcus fascians A21d2]
MKLLVASGVYTVLMFAVFVLLDSGSVWESLLQAVVAGAVFTLLTWLYLRYVSPARSTG